MLPAVTADKVGAFSGFCRGRFNARRPACLDAVQQPRHVASQVAHGLAAFLIQTNLLGVRAVHHRPVGRTDQRHFQKLGYLFHGVQCIGRARAARTGHNGCRFMAQIPPRAVCQTMHKAQHTARRRGIVYRCAENDRIGLLHQRQDLRHRPAKHALPCLGTAAAAHTAAHRGRADVENRCLYAAFVQRGGNLAECGIGAALLVRAAVDQQNIHDKHLRLYLHYTTSFHSMTRRIAYAQHLRKL